ncbi:malonate decarboxylase holo-ACP synthase [Pseudomonas entomophila]|uniref:malonate decarboxylase holo-ACP synthase n=1 Tax=Pseudomonas entomophila TaxID=312306 RepID=UPI0015E33D50|nr:malonate decarboxylase holo-ACP synthase [Pseudomonas entomophila]MBA1188114.1 malonate decarboxylase holo-ACP synthase [Pseudomonas entomophila]
MGTTYRAHDLLWGMAPTDLPAQAPEWARQALQAGQPVVVRRAVGAPGQVAVGVRGGQRHQRLGAWLPARAISRRCSPEQLRLDAGAPLSRPALAALARVTPLLDTHGLAWGPTGSVGYQLASGVEVLQTGSDLDLVIRAAQPMPREQARALYALLNTGDCRIDAQLETPWGAVALAEWAGPARRVLLKRAHGAGLVDDPWQPQEDAA